VERLLGGTLRTRWRGLSAVLEQAGNQLLLSQRAPIGHGSVEIYAQGSIDERSEPDDARPSDPMGAPKSIYKEPVRITSPSKATRDAEQSNKD
jgi:hypothetical protein